MLLARTSAAASTAAVNKVAGEAIALGDVVYLDTAGEVRKAESLTSADAWRVYGIAKQAASVSATVPVNIGHGGEVNVRFTAAPTTASIGQIVFLSDASGAATLVPNTGSGHARVQVGTLAGADGVSLTPAVKFNPQLYALRT